MLKISQELNYRLWFATISVALLLNGLVFIVSVDELASALVDGSEERESNAEEQQGLSLVQRDASLHCKDKKSANKTDSNS